MLEALPERLRKLKAKWAIPGWIMAIWGLLGHLSTLSWVASLRPKSWPKLPAARGGMFNGSFIIFLAGLVWLGVIALWPRKSKQGGGIVGGADLMVQELDISDLAIAPDLSSYEINLAAFARIEVASTDKPRTIKHFEIEMTAPDGTQYQAKSEYELGSYDYKHEVTRKDTWGFATIETVREPMEDLAAKVRIPIQPYTHVSRAWVRFEISKVKQGHEPHNCTIRIFAVDPIGVRYEINTDEMQVRTVDAYEYAVAKGQ